MDMMKERIRTEAENKRYRELIEGNRKAKSDKVSNQECHESVCYKKTEYYFSHIN
jgi:hypothetical protein